MWWLIWSPGPAPRCWAWRCARTRPGGAARQRVHRRIRRRPRVRHGRKPTRRAPGAVRGGNGSLGVAAGLTGVRRCRRRTRSRGPDLADRAIRGPEPHGSSDGAGGDRARWRTARPGNDLAGGLVRPPAAWRRWCRPACAEGAGQPHCRSCCRRDHDHDAAQHHRARRHRRPAGYPLRQAAGAEPAEFTPRRVKNSRVSGTRINTCPTPSADWDKTHGGPAGAQ
jgi:hypothetical protein